MQRLRIWISIITLIAHFISACSLLSGHPSTYEACTIQRRIGYHSDSVNGRVSPAYEIRHIPGKGLGVVTNRPVYRGTAIIIESPLIAVPLSQLTPGQGFRLTDMIPAIESAYFSLPTFEQAEFLSLYNFRYESETAEDNTLSHNLATILRSNGHNTGSAHIGLFPLCARVNHDCRPNASSWWSEITGTRIIYAMQDITAGDEITVSYIPLLKTQRERAAKLKQYGFVCQCQVCMASAEQNKKRTKIADMMVDLEGKVERKSNKRSVMDKRLATAEKLVNMVLEEGLNDYLPSVYHLAAVFSEQVGNLKAAERWAGMKLEELRLAEPDSDEALAVVDFIDDLRRH